WFLPRRNAAIEILEVGLRERGRDLARAVGAEVEEDRRVAVLRADVIAENARLDELVVLPLGVGIGERVGRRRVAAMTVGEDDRVVRTLHALPTLVAIHRPVASRD